MSMNSSPPSGHPDSLPASKAEDTAKFKSVRRVFRIMDLISRQGEDLTAKKLACQIGTNLSSCYYLLNILAEEGYLEKIPRGGGYKLGPAIPALCESSKSYFAVITEPVTEELAQRAQSYAYSAILSNGEVEVTKVKSPPKIPPVGVVEGFRGASHALALGKVLLASMGSKYVEDYINDHGGLEAFTPRTIVQPSVLHNQLNKVRLVGLATDFEEFAQNLCFLAAPVENKRGKVEGAIGLSTTVQRIHDEGRYLTEMVQWAAAEASALVKEDP